VGAPQGAGRDVSRPGPGAPGPPGSHALSGRSGVIQAMRLVGAPSPSTFEGDGREGMRATPWPRAANRGRFSLTHVTHPPERHSRIEYVNADRATFSVRPRGSA